MRDARRAPPSKRSAHGVSGRAHPRPAVALRRPRRGCRLGRAQRESDDEISPSGCGGRRASPGWLGRPPVHSRPRGEASAVPSGSYRKWSRPSARTGSRSGVGGVLPLPAPEVFARGSRRGRTDAGFSLGSGVPAPTSLHACGEVPFPMPAPCTAGPSKPRQRSGKGCAAEHWEMLPAISPRPNAARNGLRGSLTLGAEIRWRAAIREPQNLGVI